MHVPRVFVFLCMCVFFVYLCMCFFLCIFVHMCFYIFVFLCMYIFVFCVFLYLFFAALPEENFAECKSDCKNVQLYSMLTSFLPGAHRMLIKGGCITESVSYKTVLFCN